jgi:preprotein translocase subunit SecG
MQVFVFVLIILVCVFLALIVLIQNPKGGGLDSSFSSANQIGGVKRTADFLEKSTWSLAILLFVLCLVSAGLNNSGPIEEQGQLYEESEMPQQQMPVEQQQQQSAPNEIPEETPE